MAESHAGPSQDPIRISVALDGLSPPGPQEIKIPTGWHLTGGGIFKWKSHANDNRHYQEQITHGPLYIVNRLKESTTGGEWVELALWREGKWRTHIAERKTISSYQIVDLSAQGFPITVLNRHDVIRYLSDFEALNLDVIPVESVSHRLGWQGEHGEDGFLLGTNHIQGPGEAVRFQPKDAGDAQIVKGIHCKGSFEAWIEAIKIVPKFPRLCLLFFASYVPPLLEILGVPNFVISNDSPTSEGKTSAQRIAASGWGDPDERKTGSVIHTWDVTQNAVQRLGYVFSDLPLFMDDTKRAGHKNKISKIIYDIVSGQEKGRATIAGLATSGSWRGVLFSTGESPITSFSNDGGTFSRVLEIWGSPWGKTDHETGRLVNETDAVIKRNYGHAGTTYILYLIAYREWWDDWREEYHEILNHYYELAKDNPVTQRQSGYFSAILLAAKLAHQCLRLPWEYSETRDSLDQVWNSLVDESSGADRAGEALKLAISWANAHCREFHGRSDDRVPYQGLAGRWDANDAWEYIAFFPHKLNEILDTHGFEPEAIRRTWYERGWLITDKEEGRDRFTKRVRVDKQNPHLIAISRKAVERMEGKQTVSLSSDESKD